MHTIITNILAFKSKYLFWMDIPDITVTDIVEIIIIAFLFYNLMLWIKNTRAWMAFKGLLVILIFILLAAIFQMNTIIWLATKVLNFGVIAVIVVFQPEMRRALQSLGTKRFFSKVFDFDFLKTETSRFSEKTVNGIVKACFDMGKQKTGALIVVEREILLSEYERTGILLDSIVSYQLLINIFEKNTPLHDGAVLVRGDRIVAATCYLPLSENMLLSKELGTRHRAAVGISEVSDSLTIIVSEETGQVSVAVKGIIERNLDEAQLQKKLDALRDLGVENPKFGLFKRRLKDEESD